MPLALTAGLSLDRALIRGAHADENRYTGSVGVSARRSESESLGASTQRSMDLAFGIRGPVWQSWLATYSAQLRLSQLESSTGVSGDGASSLESGLFDVNVFPISRFPFRGFYELNDSRVDNRSVAALTNDERRQSRLGFEQNYQPPDSSYKLRFGLSRLDVDEIESDQQNNKTDIGFVSARTDIGGHFLDATIDFNNFETTDGAFDRDLQVYNLNHNYQFDRRMRVDTFVTASELDSNVSGQRDSNEDLQLDNLMSWFSEDNRLRLRSRILLASNDSSTTLQANESRQIEIRESLNYRYSDRVTLSGQLSYLNGTRSITDSASGTRSSADSASTNITGTASYSSAGIRMLDVTYNWSASGNLSVDETDPGPSNTTIGGTLGHGLFWSATTPWFGFPIASASANQSLQLAQSSVVDDSGTLATNLNLNLLDADAQHRTSLDLSLSENRELISEVRSIQVLTTNLSRSVNLDRYRGWSANYNVSITRQNIDSVEGVNENTNLAFDYSHRRLWEVRPLSFRSELEARAQSLNPFSDREGSESMYNWRNILEYLWFVGLLEFKASASMAMDEVDEEYVLFVSINRRFGGSF